MAKFTPPEDNIELNILEELNNQEGEYILRVSHSELYSEEQVRTEFDKSSLTELAQSMKFEQHHPIIVSPRDKKGYKIQKGERRWRAGVLADIYVDIVVRDPKQGADFVVSQLSENIQSESLNPIEISSALNRLMTDFGKTQQEIQMICAKSPTWVSTHISLLKLPPIVADLAKSKVVKDADTLNALRRAYKKDKKQTEKFILKVGRGGLSRKEAMVFYNDLKASVSDKITVKNDSEHIHLQNKDNTHIENETDKDKLDTKPTNHANRINHDAITADSDVEIKSSEKNKRHQIDPSLINGTYQGKPCIIILEPISSDITKVYIDIDNEQKVVNFADCLFLSYV